MIGPNTNPELPTSTNPFEVQDFLYVLTTFLDAPSFLNMKQVNRLAYETVDDKKLISILRKHSGEELVKFAKSNLKCALLIFNNDEFKYLLTRHQFTAVLNSHNEIKKLTKDFYWDDIKPISYIWQPDDWNTARLWKKRTTSPMLPTSSMDIESTVEMKGRKRAFEG